MGSQPELCVSAVVVDDDRLLMVRRGSGRASGSWAIPGGRVQAGELLAEAVVREVREETGIDGLCGPILGVLELVGDGEAHQVVVVHSVSLLEAVEPEAADDASAAAWVDLVDVAERRGAPGLAEFLHDHQVIETIT